MDRDHDKSLEGRRSGVERLVARSLDDPSVLGSPLSRRARQMQRTVEAYLSSGAPPRWMARIVEIEAGIAAERRRIERAYRALDEECGRDPEVFGRRWRARALSWPFAALNELIREHNDWYPVERDLPMDPRTRDYVLIRGRSYRRPELGPEWVLEQFPPWPPARR